MEVSIGTKVRVHFYPPKTTQSFVEGIVDRTGIQTMRGPGFSIETTKEVIVGHEITTPRDLPYIIAYDKEDDFEGRIMILDDEARPETLAAIEAQPESEADPVGESVRPEEIEPAILSEDVAETEDAVLGENLAETELAVLSGDVAETGDDTEALPTASGEPETLGESVTAPYTQVELEVQPETNKRGWKRFFSRAA